MASAPSIRKLALLKDVPAPTDAEDGKTLVWNKDTLLFEWADLSGLDASGLATTDYVDGAIDTEATSRSSGDAAAISVAESYASTHDATTLAAAETYAAAHDATTLAAAEAYTDTGDAATLAAAATADASTLSAAETYAASGDTTTLAAAEAHADSGDVTTLASARSYADSGDAATLATAETYAAGLLGANDAMLFKGVIDCSGNPNYPAADAGHTYKVSVAGKIGGSSGTNVEIGDMLVCTTDSSSAGTQAAVGSRWAIIQVNIDGAVTGPASSTSGDLATFSGTGGKVIQDSGVSVDADGTLTANSDAKLATQKAIRTYVAAGYQPLDSDLTAIAALTTTSFGRAVLALADAAALRTAAGLGTAATQNTGAFDASGAAAAAQAASQPVDSDLTAIAALTTTTYGRALLTLADVTALAALGLRASSVALTNSDIDVAAAIAYSKLALAAAVKTSDLAFQAQHFAYQAATYYAPEGSASVGAQTLNQALWNRIWLPAKTIDRIGLEVTTAAAATGTARVGLYASDPVTGLPTGSPLIDSGALATTSIAWVEATVSYAIPAAGWFWLCTVCQTTVTSLQIRRIANVNLMGIPVASSTTLNNTGFTTSSFATGALPTATGATFTPANAAGRPLVRLT